MPSIILKKTLKLKGDITTDKSFTFHGLVPQAIIREVNRMLSTVLTYTAGSNKPQFHLDAYGHYHAALNHNCQKYHEEDIVVVILDVMEKLGWTFRFQYDEEITSYKFTGTSDTKRELFIFHKPE